MTSIQSEHNIIYTVAEGKLTNEDYNRILPLFQEKIVSFDKVRWYFEMRDFKDWTLSAMWRDLKFDIKNKEHFEMVAMVGDKKWEKDLTRLMKPFTGAEIRFFNTEDRENAKLWITMIRDED
ncbi:SpoIIAA family protein [Salinimicrobium gaetbulicola]|uniref:STAS/SEC14 domain-containing protein n=1 Tax=Salinimicrobium gaetbulicola TaxID=999702 RepID=A0ABW3IFJ4_9FLAO